MNHQALSYVVSSVVVELPLKLERKVLASGAENSAGLACESVQPDMVFLDLPIIGTGSQQ